MKGKRIVVLAGLLVLLAAGFAVVWSAYFAPKLSLFDPDKVAQNFAAMDRIFPSSPIRVAAYSQERPEDGPEELPVAHRTIISTYEFEGQTKRVHDFLQVSKTSSLLVYLDGKLVNESYFQGYTTQTKATSFSVAKSFVATLVGIALDEGRIASLGDMAADYVPELSDSAFAESSIADLLTMSSGVEFSEVYGDPSSDAYTIYTDLYLFLQDLDSRVRSYPSGTPSGQEFAYASINTHILTMVLRRAYGQTLAQLVESKLWRPLGMPADAYWLTDTHGTEVGWWGLSARPRDFARLGLLYLNGGIWQGQRIVSGDWITAATTPGRPSIERGLIDGDWGYGLHWWLPKNSQTDYSALGIWGQMIYVNPDLRVVIVRTAADENFKSREYEAIELFRQVAAGLEGS